MSSCCIYIPLPLYTDKSFGKNIKKKNNGQGTDVETTAASLDTVYLIPYTYVGVYSCIIFIYILYI